MNEVTDEIETFLINLLDTKKTIKNTISLNAGSDSEFIGTPTIQGIVDRNLFPKSTIIINKGRYNTMLVSTDTELFLNHPIDLLDNTDEVSFFKDNDFYWIKFDKFIGGMPKNVYTLSASKTFYAVHVRSININNNTEQYARYVIGIDSKGVIKNDIFSRINNCNVSIHSNTLVSYLSMVDDFYRSNAMSAELKSNNLKINFNVPLDNYKEILLPREAPLTKTNRKKPILHWVSKHLRKVSKGKTTVKKHIRGVSDIVIDGYNVSVNFNEPNGLVFKN